MLPIFILARKNNLHVGSILVPVSQSIYHNESKICFSLFMPRIYFTLVINYFSPWKCVNSNSYTMYEKIILKPLRRKSS